MRLSTRLRVTLAAALAVAAAVATVPWVTYLWHHVRSLHSSEGFYRAFGDTASANSARWGIYRTGALFGLGILALLAVCYLLAMWALRPVRRLTGSLRNFGPQNLAQRNRLVGRRDEVRQLGDAVDEMLDRFARGYEGQRLFAANASHELRTPLAVHRALIEVSMDEPLGEAQLQLLTRQLLAANERNESLIEGLLVLSESDRGLASSSLLALDRIVSDVVEGHQDMARRADVILDVRATERIVRGERVLLERLASNLIQKAIKYNVEGGCVEVVVGDSPALAVSNTGNPVPSEAVAQLFEPFRRLASDRTSHRGGAGLGLNIARSIAQAHDGSICARPLPDGGLMVEVDLPAHA